MKPQPEDAMPGCEYYMTLMRGDLQLHLAEFVYLAKDPRLLKKHTPSSSSATTTPPMVRPVYKDVPKPAAMSSKKKRMSLDIFQIERLWKNKEE